MKIIILLCRILCGSFFALSALIKLSNVAAFAQTISAFGLVWSPLIVPVAWLLSLSELVLGLGVLFRIKMALHGMITLLLIFMAVLAYGMLLDLDIQCGCLGQADLSGLSEAFIRDVFLLVLCVLLWFKSDSGTECQTKTCR